MDMAHSIAHYLTGQGGGRLHAAFLIRLAAVPRVCRMPCGVCVLFLLCAAVLLFEMGGA